MADEIKLPPLPSWLSQPPFRDDVKAYATQAVEAYKAQQQGEAMSDLQGRLVAISLAVADRDDRTAQSLLSETLRLLAASHNAGAKP